jgi:AcrR family transcriptional regulator
MYPLGERGQAREIPVVRRGDLAGIDAAVGIRDGHRTNEKEGGTAPGPSFEVRQLRVRDAAVLVGERISHRRHEDPVPQRQGTDRAGCEQVGEVGHGGKLRPACPKRRSGRPVGVDSVYRLVDTVNMTATAAPSTRDLLVATARDYLDTEGLDGIGLREIARRAGLSHGAPLRHFPTLGRLLAAVAAEGFRDLYASVAEQLDHVDVADPRGRLAASAFGYVRFAAVSPGVFGLMFRADLCDTADPDYATEGSIAFGQLVDLVVAAQADGFHPDAVPEELAGVLWATMHGLASLHLHGALVPTTGQTDLDVLVRLANQLAFGASPTPSEDTP